MAANNLHANPEKLTAFMNARGFEKHPGFWSLIGDKELSATMSSKAALVFYESFRCYAQKMVVAELKGLLEKMDKWPLDEVALLVRQMLADRITTIEEEMEES